MATYTGWKAALTAALGKVADITAVDQITLTAPLVLTIPAGFPAGQVYRVTLTQDATGGHTVTFGGDPVAVDTAAGAQTLVEVWPLGGGRFATVVGVSPAAATTTTTTTAATTTTTTTTGSSAPTAGTLAVTNAVATGGTFTVTGATGGAYQLDAAPYSYSTDDGSTWTEWTSQNPKVVYTAATGWRTCLHRVRDTMGTITVGSSVSIQFRDWYRTAPDYLVTPTYDGSGQAVHPSVVDFGTAWNGWRYWMAMTPYAFSNDTLENPSILVSADGLAWQEPAGITNPIHDWSGVVGEYNSDTELVYDPDADRLICYWREHAAGVTTIYAQTSTNGTTWSAPASVGISGDPTDILSPCVIRRAAGDWWMFCIWQNYPNNNASVIKTWRSTAPLSGWSETASFTTVARANYWHCGVMWDGSQFRMLASTTQAPNAIHALSTIDGSVWAEQQAGDIMTTASSTAWDNKLYRPFILAKDASTMRVWYSGRAAGDLAVAEWHIGYTEVPRSLWPDAAATTTTTTTAATTTTTTTAATTTTTTTSGAWSPASLTPGLWLDASDAATITSSAGLVSQWNDKSGNSRHVTQTTEAGKPTTGGTAINGVNALTFSGTHSLRTANGAYQPTSMSIFAVMTSATDVGTGAWAVLWPHHPTSWSTPWSRHALSRGTSKLRGLIETVSTESDQYVLVPNTPLLAGFTTSDATIYKNGAAIKTGAAGGAATYPNSVPVIIGANSAGGEGWNGQIGEVVILTGTIAQADREKLEGYLAHKWGIASNLPAGHPYKSAPPA